MLHAMLRVAATRNYFTKTYSTSTYDGLINLIGTEDGAVAYSNPANSKITATQINVLRPGHEASNAFDHGLSYSGEEDAHTQDTPFAWWKVDFGGEMAVKVDTFGLQNRDESIHSPTDYKLEGSNDDSTWTVLQTVAGGTTVAAAWDILTVTDATSWRYLKITQTGTSSAGADYLVIGEVEIWGTLTVATSYNLEWRDVSTQTTTQITGIDDLFYDLTGLAYSTAYEFRVQGDDGSTQSAWSAWSGFLTALGITADLQKLAPGSIIDLYELDATNIGSSLFRWVPEVNELNNDIVWQGNTYSRTMS